MMATANYKCPTCNGRLRAVGRRRFRCRRCDDVVREVVFSLRQIVGRAGP